MHNIHIILTRHCVEHKLYNQLTVFIAFKTFGNFNIALYKTVGNSIYVDLKAHRIHIQHD